MTLDELEFYKMLINVNSIGPKSGLSLLSFYTVGELANLIVNSDAKAIAKTPGVGNKSAEKIIIDLKDKISVEDAFEEKLAKSENAEDVVANEAKSDAVLALNALGYANTEILKAISKIENIKDLDTQGIIKAALSLMH